MKKLIFFIAFVCLISSISALSCDIVSKASCTQNKILYLSGATNAHASKIDVPAYTHVLCCDALLATSCNADDSNLLLRMSSDTNAHIGVPEITGSYPNNKICLNGISCKSNSGTCATGYDTKIISLTSVTNSHIGDLNNNNYPIKICCKSSETPVGESVRLYFTDMNGAEGIFNIKRSKATDSSADLKMIFENYSGTSQTPSFVIKYQNQENPITVKTITGSASGKIANAVWTIDCNQDFIAKGIDVTCDLDADLTEPISGLFFEAGGNISEGLSMNLIPEDGTTQCNGIGSCFDYNVNYCQTDNCHVGATYLEQYTDGTCEYELRGISCTWDNELNSCNQNTNPAVLISGDSNNCNLNNCGEITISQTSCDSATNKRRVNYNFIENPSCNYFTEYDCASLEMLGFFDNWNFIVSLIIIIGVYIVIINKK